MLLSRDIDTASVIDRLSKNFDLNQILQMPSKGGDADADAEFRHRFDVPDLFFRTCEKLIHIKFFQ